MFRSHRCDVRRRLLIAADGHFDPLRAKQLCRDDRRNAEEAEWFSSFAEPHDRIGDLRKHFAVRTGDGVIAEILCRAVAAGDDEAVEDHRVDVPQVPDRTTRDAGRFDQHVSRFVFRYFAREMIDYMALSNVGCEADRFGLRLVERQQGQYRFMDFRSVIDATP